MIGGAQLFGEALHQANKVYVTLLDTEVQADTYAPDIAAQADDGAWNVAEDSGWKTSSAASSIKSGIARYRFLTYVRNR